MWAFFVSEIFYFQEPVTCVRPDAADDKASSGTSASVVTGVVLAGGAARGAVRVCKVMGLDQAGAFEYLRALLPELPQADAERLIRYYWRDDIDSTAATERIDDKIKHRITMAVYRTQYNGACCEQFEESYLKGAVYALAETINRCGPLLDEDYLQRAADRLELPLENLKKRLDAVMKEFFSE